MTGHTSAGGNGPAYVNNGQPFESDPWSFERIVEVVEAMSGNAGHLESGWAKLGNEAE